MAISSLHMIIRPQFYCSSQFFFVNNGNVSETVGGAAVPAATGATSAVLQKEKEDSKHGTEQCERKPEPEREQPTPRPEKSEQQPEQSETEPEQSEREPERQREIERQREPEADESQRPFALAARGFKKGGLERRGSSSSSGGGWTRPPVDENSKKK